MAKRRTKGEGSIYYNKKSSRWVAQITLPNGQRKSKSSKTQQVVRDWLIKQRNTARQGLFIEDRQIKLGKFLDRYMEDVAKHFLRPRSYGRNEEIINLHMTLVLMTGSSSGIVQVPQ